MIEDTNPWILVAERELARPIACEILQTCASSQSLLLLATAVEMGHGVDSTAADLALAAWEFCADKLGWHPHTKTQMDFDLYWLICAEAEAVLQQGWNPGDKYAC